MAKVEAAAHNARPFASPPILGSLGATAAANVVAVKTATLFAAAAVATATAWSYFVFDFAVKHGITPF